MPTLIANSLVHVQYIRDAVHRPGATGRCQGISFKSATEERNWRSTTEVQMSMPLLDCRHSHAGTCIFPDNPRKIDKLCEIYEARPASLRERDLDEP